MVKGANALCSDLAEFRMIDDTRQKPHGFIGIVYNNLSASKTMISFITNSRRSCPGGLKALMLLAKLPSTCTYCEMMTPRHAKLPLNPRQI